MYSSCILHTLELSSLSESISKGADMFRVETPLNMERQMCETVQNDSDSDHEDSKDLKRHILLFYCPCLFVLVL